MASTPPPPSARARTPPTPLHGARYDAYEPYSPRRSKRSTAHSNPYSSFNGERSPRVVRGAEASTPPATVKRARFARAPTNQLSSPPSSPPSPVGRRRPSPPSSPPSPVGRRRPSPTYTHKTPRKQLFSSAGKETHPTIHSDSDGPTPSHSLGQASMHPIGMLPTPSKTPKKRQATVASTARILNFQPDDPNDVMPSPRRLPKGQRQQQQARLNGFDLYDEDDVNHYHHHHHYRHAEPNPSDNIEIFTDANARIPELDGCEDNPFVGTKKTTGGAGGRKTPRRGSARKSKAERERDACIDAAVRRDEGVSFVFRGRKMFRRFEDATPEADTASEADSSTNKLSASPEQRLLRQQAGAAAQRPLTRSAIQPRLLFPSEDQLHAREEAAMRHEAEEAATDVEMPNVDDDDEGEAHPISPPPTVARGRRSSARKGSASVAAVAEPATPIDEEVVDGDGDGEVTSPGDSFLHRLAAPSTNGRTKQSLFDTWPRTKSGRKRAGEMGGAGEGSGGSGGGKRARGGVVPDGIV